MTEEVWLTSTDPQPMLEYIQGRASDRKLRLFAVECCRRIWDRIISDSARNVVEVVERHADGLASRQDALSAAAEAEGNSFNYDTTTYRASAAAETLVMVGNRTRSCQVVAACAAYAAGDASEPRIQSELLRHIFGNPFRPVLVDPRWFTSTAVGLARTVYEECAFDRLPILADALEEAGCDEPAVLDHCRSDGPHVRGCWAVDLVLGKE